MKKAAKIALILCSAFGIYILAGKIQRVNSKKIGIVEMDKLVYDYKGMKEATRAYSLKVKAWTAESDSLARKLEELYKQIRVDSLSADKNKLARDVKTFLIYKQSYAEHINKSESNAQDEDKQMTLGVLTQISEHIRSFAKENGYDAVLCNSHSQYQSIAYVDGSMDITQNVLEFANTRYEGLK